MLLHELKAEMELVGAPELKPKPVKKSVIKPANHKKAMRKAVKKNDARSQAHKTLLHQPIKRVLEDVCKAEVKKLMKDKNLDEGTALYEALHRNGFAELYLKARDSDNLLDLLVEIPAKAVLADFRTADEDTQDKLVQENIKTHG